jgi:hypothetical protein
MYFLMTDDFACWQDLLNIAPKRANWDLKREMDKKMARLERRTQEAIHTLIRKSIIHVVSHIVLITFTTNLQVNDLWLRRENQMILWEQCAPKRRRETRTPMKTSETSYHKAKSAPNSIL